MEKTKMIVVTGGSASGKSAFAERLAMECTDGEKLYIATMKPLDAESRSRIVKHRAMRARKNFHTVECYGLSLWDVCLSEMKKQEQSAGRKCQDSGNRMTGLFECMSNYAANCLFGERTARDFAAAGHDGWEKRLADLMVSELVELNRRLGTLIIVSNEIFSDGERYEESTMAYLRVLGECNQRLAEMANQVYEVVCGIPLLRKG